MGPPKRPRTLSPCCAWISEDAEAPPGPACSYIRICRQKASWYEWSLLLITTSLRRWLGSSLAPKTRSDQGARSTACATPLMLSSHAPNLHAHRQTRTPREFCIVRWQGSRPASPDSQSTALSLCLCVEGTTPKHHVQIRPRHSPRRVSPSMRLLRLLLLSLLLLQTKVRRTT
jgi:hypothetical protein